MDSKNEATDELIISKTSTVNSANQWTSSQLKQIQMAADNLEKVDNSISSLEQEEFFEDTNLAKSCG